MTTNIFELLNTVQVAANRINDSHKLAVPMLATKAKRAALELPNDQGLRVLSNVLSKMNENGKIFISRGEFKELYFKVASSKTAAVNVFSEELDLEEQNPDRPIAGEKLENQELKPYEGADALGDPALANAIGSLWDVEGLPSKDGTIKAFNSAFAKQAEILTNLELGRLGFGPKAVTTFGGTSDFIICDAKYETPKGEAHILVPVELSASGALIPTIFISKFGAVDLSNRDALKESILNSKGSFRINPEQLIKALSLAKEASTLSEFELKALAAQEKINMNDSEKIQKQASDYKVMYASPAVVGQKVNEFNSSNCMLQVEPIKGTEKIAELLNSGKGLAELTFGKTIVENGREVIASKMASFGYNSQVTVSSTTDDAIIYAVGIHSGMGPVGFEVVAEVVNNKINIPTVAAIKDKVFDFSKSGIDNMVRNQASDPVMVAKVSPMYGLKPSELLETIRIAADNKNYLVAEDALNILATTSTDKTTYVRAMAEYLRSLEKPEISKEASSHNGCRCSMIIKSSAHIGPICGHLNLPLDKVYQNERGECVPMYRKGMSDTYEGILFNTSKIFQ